MLFDFQDLGSREAVAAFDAHRWSLCTNALARHLNLYLTECQADDPAAAHMRPIAAAMGDDLLAVATGVHQGVGEDRHAVEGAFVVDGPGQIDDGGSSASAGSSVTGRNAGCRISPCAASPPCLPGSATRIKSLTAPESSSADPPKDSKSLPWRDFLRTVRCPKPHFEPCPRTLSSPTRLLVANARSQEGHTPSTFASPAPTPPPRGHPKPVCGYRPPRNTSWRSPSSRCSRYGILSARGSIPKLDLE